MISCTKFRSHILIRAGSYEIKNYVKMSISYKTQVQLRSAKGSTHVKHTHYDVTEQDKRE